MVHNKNLGSYKQSVIPPKTAVSFTVGKISSYGDLVSKLETYQHTNSVQLYIYT